MRTPKKYTDSIKKGIITEEILADCLFSVNKRAKNCRDKEQQYYGEYQDKYRESKMNYYKQKDKMLSIVEPAKIHYETVTITRRIYDYEYEFSDYYRSGNYHYSNCYYDHDEKEVVEFVDIREEEKRYYLFYRIGDKSFHHPIDEDELQEYPNMEITDIGRLTTFGRDVHDLLSPQFVKKVITLIDSKNYIYKQGRELIA